MIVVIIIIIYWQSFVLHNAVGRNNIDAMNTDDLRFPRMSFLYVYLLCVHFVSQSVLHIRIELVLK